MTSDRRFPRRLYQQGDEPDPRFSLANERTFLAWIRTSLALMAVGVAIEALALPILPGLRLAAALAFIVLGAIAAVHSWIGWLRTERSLRAGTVLAGPSTGAIVVVGLLLAATVVMVGLLV